MDRPMAVAILAVVHWLEGAMLLLMAVLLLLLLQLTAQFGGVSFSGPGSAAVYEMLRLVMRAVEFGGMGLVLGAVGGVAVLFVVIGLGLWWLRNWARLLTIVFMVLRLPLVAAGVLWAWGARDILSLSLQLPMVLVYGWIIWYLYQPAVKRVFRVT